MNFEKYTIKSQEAILKAQQIAAGNDQQNVDTVHLRKGILETEYILLFVQKIECK